MAVYDQSNRIIDGNFSGTNFVDSSVQANTTYTYSIWNVDWSTNPPTQLSKVASSNSVNLSQSCQQNNPTPTINNFTVNNFTCQSNATVTWSTSNVNNVKLYVKTDNNAEQDFANLPSGSQTVNWVVPGHTYVFRLHGDGISDQTQTISPASNACGSTPAPTVNSFSAGNFVCPSSATITWSTSNINNVKLYVKTNNNPEQDFANLPSGSQTVNWVVPGNTYVFRLHGDGITDQTQTLSPASNACSSGPLRP